MDSATDRRHSSPGFPHSGIPGSRPACGFPRLIAACYALHRLLMPRHPPYTLNNLTSLTSDTHDLGSVYSVVKEPPARGRRTYLIVFIPLSSFLPLVKMEYLATTQLKCFHPQQGRCMMFFLPLPQTPALVKASTCLH